MKILFIGGTGIISSACSRHALKHGYELYLLNRGKTTSRPVPEGAYVLPGDIRDHASAHAALHGHSFDVVVNWIAFTPEHIQFDLDLFSGSVGQYIFISSASAYQTPPASLPVTESTILDNPYWQYSRNKIACEEMLVRAYRDSKFPATIVRPSHTYDKTLLPFHGGFTEVERMRKGKKVVVHGDGTSLWTLTHHDDFARGFTGLLGNPHALGEAFHITSDEWLSWNQIHEIVAYAAGTTAQLVPIPSKVIAAYDPNWGASLLGDKAHSMIFDNTKIKRTVPEFRTIIPFARGVDEIMGWFDENPARQKIDEHVDNLMDQMIADYETGLPKKNVS
jgi:nucleoside-diphosphate-sugar epimerase